MRFTDQDAARLRRDVRDILTRLSQQAIRWRYAMPRSPYQRLSANDRAAFDPVLRVWKPGDAPDVVILRWFMTEWCNYTCPYCSQTHARDAGKGHGLTAHAFDNFSVESWQQAFERHFGDTRLAVLMTGGEPFVDRKSMVPFLAFLAAMPAVQSIRIDTNAWWKPEPYRDLDKSKIVLMCTLHPSQTPPARFLQRIDALMGAGFHVGMVNYVMSAENLPHYLHYKEGLRQRRIPLHPNPLWDSTGTYSADDLHLLKSELEEADFLYRSGIASPKGEKCLYPALAYELDYLGRVQVGCHAAASGNFFAPRLPRLFMGPVPCPMSRCVCLDKYSFLSAMNRNTSLDPLRTYGELLRSRRRLTNAGPPR
jgi:hypothetical protein